ncbi:SLAC1 anion channel family protein [uncultured Cohaesibacter sp.]|uniref:SLAC1 anion channel family protein n=1 Tax=uncultured Cohaesibacter sp. TaxID=1002546 RepID=UPI002AAA89AD|nr:SLAC1 anion channel family protein [uncultured Cohaesibacter sp.]
MSQTNKPQEAISSSAAAAHSGTSGSSAAKPDSRLEHFPNAFFAMVMGLAGFTLATERLEKSFGMEHSNSLFLLTFTGIIFAILLGIYLLKAIRYPAAISWEWHHPVRLCFFPAASIGLILMGTAFGPFSHALSFGFWAVGSALHLFGTLAVLSTWIGHRNFELMHLNPAWFIPVVGNILVPIAGSRLGYTEISWFFFAIGILFWIVLLTLVFNRLVFHNPLPERLLPTLMILIAPPAVGFVSFVSLTGGIDPFSRILYYTGVFFFMIILLQVPKLSRISFAMSWWAYSFPLAALTISTLLYAEKIQSGIHETIGYGLFGLLVLVIIGLLIRTMKAILGGDICQPE